MLTPTMNRDNVIAVFKCTHSELGDLLRRKISPLPVRIEGAILWYADEINEAQEKVQTALKNTRYWKSQKMTRKVVA